MLSIGARGTMNRDVIDITEMPSRARLCPPDAQSFHIEISTRTRKKDQVRVGELEALPSCAHLPGTIQRSRKVSQPAPRCGRGPIGNWLDAGSASAAGGACGASVL